MSKKYSFFLMFFLLGILIVGCGKKTVIKESKEGVIRIAYKDENSSNPNTKKYFDELSRLMKENGTEVIFEVVDLSSEGYGEQLNLKFASGDIPDIIYFQGGDTTVANQGLLENLTPYVEDSVYLKTIMEPQNIKRLEAYPYILWVKTLSASTPVIKKDLFNQLESRKTLMDNPTVENYETFFKEMIGKVDNQNQAVKYGITTSGNIKELDNIFNMAFGNNKTWLKTNDGYQYAKISENEKKKIAFYRKLYKEKLLDSEFLTKKWDTKENAFYDGTSGVILGTSGKVIDMYNDKVQQLNDTALVVLPPAKGIDQGYGAVDVSKETRGIAVSSLSSNKELAFKVLDFLASPKGQQLDRLGFEGEHYDVVDNKISITEEGTQWYAKFWEPLELNIEIPLSQPFMSDVAQSSQKEVAKYYQEDNVVIIPEELVSKWDATENLYNEYMADIITGKKDLSEFDSFVEEWKNSGGDEITKYVESKLEDTE